MQIDELKIQLAEFQGSTWIPSICRLEVNTLVTEKKSFRERRTILLRTVNLECFKQQKSH